MASAKPSYGWSEMSAAELKKIPLPDRFLCRSCKKWKSPPQYSNKQLNDYRFKVQKHQQVTQISAELRCRNCTGDQTQELVCIGPCGLWKGLDDFSKNQRRRPENAWCVSCTQWKEANEPGVTPAAPPNNLLSPDEEREVVETEMGFGAFSTNDIEGDADSDDDDIGFIYNNMASITIADDGMSGSNGGRGKAPHSKATSTPLPGYLTGAKKMDKLINTKSSLSNPYAARSEYAGEGGKPGPELTKSENNPLDNAASDGNTAYSNGTDRAAMDVKKPKAGLSFNAWDNVGQKHNQYRVPSQTTAPSGSAGLPGRSDAQPVSSGQAGGWAKQTRATRNPPPQFPALCRPIRQNVYDDEDDSPDEM